MSLIDLDAVMKIAKASPAVPQWTHADYASALAVVEPVRRICRVMTGRRSLIGFVVAGIVMPEAEIESIAISPELQGQGFGSLLLRCSLKTLARAGASEVYLEVRASNKAAQALYQREGFEETGRRPGYYVCPMEDAILFHKSLAGFPMDDLPGEISTI